VGGKRSGKSSIIAKFLDPKSKKETNPTVALEYLFGRKSSDTGTRIVHLWELGGGIHLSDLIKVALTKENFANAVCLVTVDLSKPEEVVDTARYWLRIIQHRAEAVASELQEDGVDVVQLMSDKAGSPQAKGIPVYIVANKYDLFKDADPKARHDMARTLRAMALEVGASLIYMCAGDSSDKELQSCIKVFRSLLNANVFFTDRFKVLHTDENKALAISVGTDQEEKLGKAPGGDHSSVSWARNLQAVYPPPDRENEGAREAKVQAIQQKFSALDGGRRELRQAFTEMGFTKLAELVHTSEVGGTPQVSKEEFTGLTHWWRSMLVMEGIEGEVSSAFDIEEYKESKVDATREMRNHELEKYRKACEAKIRKELALKGERKSDSERKSKR